MKSRTKYPIIILAAHNTGEYVKVEREEKKVGKVLDEKFLIGNKAMLRAGPGKKKIIEHVLSAVKKSKNVSEIIVVGPDEMRKFLGKNVRFIMQGKNLYENVQKSLNHLNSRKYSGKVFFLLGDVPFIDAESVDSLIRQAGKEDGEILFAMTPRKDIRRFITKNHLEEYRLPAKIRFPIPLPGRLNKFGPVLKDDKFSKDLKKDMYISGNAFFIDTTRIDKEDFDSLVQLVYSGRKGLFDSKNWKLVFGVFGIKNLIRLFIYPYTITDAEYNLNKISIDVRGGKRNFMIRAIRADADFALDVDSENDLERCRAYFRRR